MSQGDRLDLKYKDEIAAELSKGWTYSERDLLKNKHSYNAIALHEALLEAHNLATLAKKCSAAYFEVDKARAILKAQASVVRKKLEAINFKSDCPFSDLVIEHTDELPHGNRRLK